MTEKNDGEKCDDCAGMCNECAADKRDVQVAWKLNQEITQAINRAISKTDGDISIAALVMPMAANTALTLLKWERSGGGKFEHGLEHFVSAVAGYRDLALEDAAREAAPNESETGLQTNLPPCGEPDPDERYDDLPYAPEDNE